MSGDAAPDGSSDHASDRGGNQFDTAPGAWRRAGLAHASAAIREITHLIWPWPSMRAVASIRCPVTLLIGDIGEALFHRTSNRLRRALPDPRIVGIENSAHLIAVDQPRALADVAREAALTSVATGRETRRPSLQEPRE